MIFQGTGCSGFIRIGIENYYDYVRICIEQTVRIPIKRRQKKNRKKRIIIHPYDVNDVSVIYAFAKLNSIRLKSFEQNVSKYTAYMNSISIILAIGTKQIIICIDSNVILLNIFHIKNI